MSAGRKDRRVLIQRLFTVQDSYGQTVHGWSDVGSVWAEFKPVSGVENYSDASLQRSAGQTATFGMRFQPGIEPTMRIIFDGQPWEITDVAEPVRRKELVLTAFTTEVMPGGGG